MRFGEFHAGALLFGTNYDELAVVDAKLKESSIMHFVSSITDVNQLRPYAACL